MNVTPEGFRCEPRWCRFCFSFVRKLTENCQKVDGKLSQNSAECQCPRNIPSSLSELVGLTWSACRKSVTSPWYLSTASSGQAGGVFRQLFLAVQCVRIKGAYRDNWAFRNIIVDFDLNKSRSWVLHFQKILVIHIFVVANMNTSWSLAMQWLLFCHP